MFNFIKIAIKRTKKTKLFIIVQLVLVLFLIYHFLLIEYLKSNRSRFNKNSININSNDYTYSRVYKGPINGENFKCQRDELNETDVIRVSMDYYKDALDYIMERVEICENKTNEIRLLKVNDIYLYKENNEINKKTFNLLKRQNIIIQENLKNITDLEFFHVKLDFSHFEKEYNHSSSITCTLNLYDKIYNRSEGSRDLNILEKRNFTFENKYEIYLNKSGFYFVECFNKTYYFYNESFLILPQKMQKLIENRKQFKVDEIDLVSSEDISKHYDGRKKVKNPLNLKKKMNLLFMKFDSISKKHFKRIFPSTYKYLVEKMKNNIFYDELSSVGENSYPNMVPILTGIIVDPLVEYKYESEVDKYRDKNGYFDHLPFIWNEFEKEGYLTMYQEDMPSICQFNYNKPGFRWLPTAVYAKPYWVEHYRKRNDSSRCINGIPTYKKYFELLENFMDRMNTGKNKNIPYVSFNFHSEYTHDDIAVPLNMDKYLKNMLQKFETKGYFNNTLLILFSDHGK